MLACLEKSTMAGFSFILALTACGQIPSVDTSASPQATKSMTLIAQSGQVTFPAVNGIIGIATYNLTALPPSAVTLTLSTITDPATIPAPLGNQASVLVAFTIESSQTIQLSSFPAWQVSVPAASVLTPPYGVEVFDGQMYLASYAADSTNNAISAASFGPAVSATSGHKYTYEIVQNAALTQFPH